MAAVSNLKFRFFTDLANPVFQCIISGVLQSEEYISDIISTIFSCFDLQIQDGRRQQAKKANSL